MAGLAYIGRVEKLMPIAKAHRIESAEVFCGVGGRWTGVVKRGDFAVGDRTLVYLQDAVVTPSEELKFLEATKWRVKMARFRGAPSECVILPAKGDEPIGTDLTETLGVVKYVKVLPHNLAGDAIGPFPSFIPKTDEPNFQTAAELIDALRGKPWYARVKADGSSTTAYKHEGRFGVCSRSLELADSACAYWRVAKQYNLAERLPEGLALQYETVGPGIQKNPMGLAGIDGRAFSAWSIGEKRYLCGEELATLCEAIGFPIAEFAVDGESFDFDAEQLRKLAEGTYANGEPREGIVIRPKEDEWVGATRLSFKVINLLCKD